MNGKISVVQLKQAEELTKVKTEYSIRIDALEKAVSELKASCEQAKKDYSAAHGWLFQENARDNLVTVTLL